MSAINVILQALAQRLGCAHVILHAPSLAAETIVPEPAAGDRGGFETLVRSVLRRVARQSAQPQILNRARLSPGTPLLPYRVLLVPLVIAGRTAGFIAALRRRAAAPFGKADAAALIAAATELAERPARAGAGESALIRRPDFEAEIALRAQATQVASVLYVDLDRLHAINELNGFAVGDEMIRAVGSLLQAQLLPSGSIASRLSGDRYAAVLFDHTLNQARACAERLREGIANLQVGASPARITASLGVAPLPRSESFEHALAAAETACRAAKDRGRNRVEIFEPGDTSIIRRHDDVREFRLVLDALESDRLELHAQPIVNLSERGSQLQFEVLLRILGSDGILRSIGDYLHAVERYQVFDRLDRWVVESTLRQLGPRASQLMESGIRFAINVTGQSLGDVGFADFVRAGMVQCVVPGALLGFEFTETAAVRNLEATHRFIRRLSELGCCLALDDFGTGVSSLLHLKELAVHRIKIDGRFIRDVRTNPRSEALVRALCQIAGSLGLETVAEYIETEDTAAFLQELGVQYGQGYLFGRSRPLAGVLAGLLDVRGGAPQLANA